MSLKLLKLLGLVLIIGLSTVSVQAQIPTDTAVLPYQISVVVNVIVDGFEAPNVQNEYVQSMQAEQDFPNLSLNAPVSQEQLTDLKQWVKTHPTSIEKLLIDRKKYYDLYQLNQQ